MGLVLAGAIGGVARAQDLGQLPSPGPQAPPAKPALTKPPALLKTVEPVYPPEALAEKAAADVSMTVDLDATGRVTAVDVPRPVGRGFDEAAKAAVLQYQFSPAEIDGKPAPIRIEYTLHFVPRATTADTIPEAPGEPAPEQSPSPPPADVVVASGQIREKGTREPLAGVELSVIPRTAEGVEKPALAAGATDQDGRFQIKGQPGIAFRVVATDPRHQACVRDVTAADARADRPAQLDCLVARQRGTSYETTVKASPSNQAVTRYTLAQPELTTVPGTFGDPLRVVQSQPGVARTPYGLGLLVIRGASPLDSGVFVEGHSVPLLYHFLAGPSVLAPQLIDHIDFYPGNFGVKYGRATAGIVDVGVKSDATPRLHGQADLNLLDSSAYVEGPLGGAWSGSLSARRSYLDLLLARATPSNATASVAPVFWDYQATVHRDLGSGKLALFAFGSNDTLRVISKEPSEGDLRLDSATGFHKVIGVWTASAHGWANRLSPAYGHERDRLTAGGIDIDEAANTFALRDELSHDFGARFTWRLGFDGELRKDTLFFHLPVAPDSRLYGDTIPMFQQRDIGLGTLGAALFTDAVWEPGAGVTLIPGLRGDYGRASGQDRFTFDPRLAARWKMTPTHTWKAGVGVFHQMQLPQLLNAEFGNPTLPPIAADQYSLGFVHQLTPKLSLDTTLYYVSRHDQAVPVATAANFDASGKGRSYGLELILKHEFTERFYGWLAYTLSRSEQTAYSIDSATQSNAGLGTLQTGPTATHWSPTDFDQTHNLIVVGSYAWGAWRFGSRFRLVTGAPDTPLGEGAFDADSGQYACQAGATNSTRKPTFAQLDVRVDRMWTFSAWQLGAYIDVQNVTNAQNPEAILHDYRCRGSAPVRGLPLLPVIGVRGLF